ncbi:GntR family transcriptional regulator [Clostridium sporogenes]|uniref:GntR family transcriptional regulator n=2 Tax=Clostridium TaxID=1485 RepID=A0AAE4YZG6_CLOSG|nr:MULTISPECIES: TrkA C-terminal domain-containing protein [Clostridium]EKS4344282.1 GntR family transcriptional regulator [Clostridium botulinum]MBE6076717.1 GntR family transcriptional regulator [Clostridium lundense]EDU37679.1 TrkA C-terminal domain protein [Clostridium sporogenes ATCC 15579]EKS4394160.1 GntR family transcriptional regulator [Clostridium botulinum]KIS23125.1 GntR family transcriptional regulator [Clostridium botulinum B2 450]
MENTDTPKYMKIAIDIAQKIYNNEFKVGEKVRGRSTLSSKYNVSPETIRRAVSLLKDMQVVEVTEKSGIYIKSVENAYLFIHRFNAKNNVKELRQKIKSLKKEKNKLEREIDKYMDLILENSIQFENINLEDAYEIVIYSNSYIVNKTISDTEFWKHTNGTIISVKRKDKMYISPGPYFRFEAGDIARIICSEDDLNRAKNYIQQGIN